MLSVSIFLALLLAWSVRGEPCAGTTCECTRGGTPARVVKIDCSNRGLTEMPGFTELHRGDLDLVDFSGNNFVTFDPFDFGFQFVGVTSLVILDLSDNQLTSIVNPFAYSNQTHQSPQYDALNLSRNNFEIFPSNAIPRDGFNNVELIIDISNNRLTSLPARFIADNAPVGIPTLRFDAKNNMIDSVHPLAFSGAGTANLFLDLSGNSLTSLPSDFFFPESMNNGFDMSDNPWNCDCNFRWVVTSYLRKVWRSFPPTCYDPLPIRGREIFDLRPDDFVCVPEQEADASTREFLIAPGDNVLACPATADPQSTLGITWRFVLPCPGRPVTLLADAKIATINDVTCFPEANISCTAFNYGGDVEIDLNVISSREVGLCPARSGGVSGRSSRVSRRSERVSGRSGRVSGRGGFIFLVILVFLSWIAVACLAGYYYYHLRRSQRSGQTKSSQVETSHYRHT